MHRLGLLPVLFALWVAPGAAAADLVWIADVKTGSSPVLRTARIVRPTGLDQYISYGLSFSDGMRPLSLYPFEMPRRVFDGTRPAGGFRVFLGAEVATGSTGLPSGEGRLTTPDGAEEILTLSRSTDFPASVTIDTAHSRISDAGELTLALLPPLGVPPDAFLTVIVREAGSIVYSSPGYNEDGMLPASTREVRVPDLNPGVTVEVEVTIHRPVRVSRGSAFTMVHSLGASSVSSFVVPVGVRRLWLSPNWPSDERLARGNRHLVRTFLDAGQGGAPTDLACRLLRDGAELARSTNGNFLLDTDSLPAWGTYQVEIRSGAEVRWSRTFSLEVVPTQRSLRIVRQPWLLPADGSKTWRATVDAVGPNGERFVMGSFAGISPVSFQWLRNGQLTPFAGPMLILPEHSPEAAGAWTVLVSCAGLTQESAPLVLTAHTPRPTADLHLTNLSARLRQPLGETSILGVVSEGPAHLLLRHVGEGLRPFGISQPARNPALQAYAGTRFLAQNDDWIDRQPEALQALFLQAGAFALEGAPQDAALSLLTEGGGITAHLRQDGEPGTSLAEVYALKGALKNASFRGRLEKAGDLAVLGFTLTGTGAKRYLLRALGRSLADFGLRSQLDPSMRLYAGAFLYAENTAWEVNQDPAVLQEACRQAGASPLRPELGESALVVTLSAGAYTVVISGEQDTSGEGLWEIWELP